MQRSTGWAAASIGALLLAACGGGDRSAEVAASPSAGQVAPAAPAAKVTFYAASRFAEQASFGATAALVAELQAKGFAQWIDEQFALPASQIDPTPLLGFVDPTPDADWRYYRESFPRLAVSTPDQLRLRVTWSISNFIVASDRKGDLVGAVYWINLLQQRALGRYDDLLYHASINPFMGQYLDNIQNRPKSAECPHCAPNENYARELMQLFTVGVNKLNADGSPMRDAKGKFIETYSQKDVEELARVLTGWREDRNPERRPNRNWGNWAKPMVPTTWPPERDAGTKQVLGKTFPAGQTQEQDLRDAVGLLMAHPNIAPFVAVRMIQHLVKSNPTPAYAARVAAAFRNNGGGVAGDMKAVVKAVLLDAEARAGDNPVNARSDDGKFREPFQHNVALWRGLGCTKVPATPWNGVAISGVQTAFNQDSVFGFYAPTDRAPGSNLLAPEQRLLNAVDIRDRLSFVKWPSRWNEQTNKLEYPGFAGSGCQIDALSAAFRQSPRAFNDLLALRYFRGTMPPTLRTSIEQMMREQWPPWNKDDPYEGALRMTAFALATPSFGVVK